jgi:putative acetyltransferase
MTADAPAELLIRPETPDEQGEVRKVHALAFGDGERVPALVDALRAAKAVLPPLSFVATLGGRVVGHVMLSACRLDALPRLVDVYSLSPLGVLPEHQGHRIGTKLVEHALAAADQRGVPLVFLEGSPHYYGKRGFRAAGEMGFRAPTLRYPPGTFQVAQLSTYQDWMTGTFVYSETFWALDCVGLRGPRLSASAVTARRRISLSGPDPAFLHASSSCAPAWESSWFMSCCSMSVLLRMAAEGSGHDPAERVVPASSVSRRSRKRRSAPSSVSCLARR